MVYIQEIIYHGINDRAYVINLDKHESTETQWIVLHVNGNNIF